MTQRKPREFENTKSRTVTIEELRAEQARKNAQAAAERNRQQRTAPSNASARPTQAKPVARPAQPAKKSGGSRKRKGNKGLLALIIAIIVVIIAVVILLVTGVFGGKNGGETQPSEKELEGPPQPCIESTAMIGATGDILLHDSVLRGANYGGYYDFSDSFAAVRPYWSEPDLMIANLEVTLGGEESGSYRGYPSFNAPDAIIPALMDAGVDMVLTANNHTYDTGEYGMMRTLDVLEDYGMEYTGTRLETSDPYIRIKDINGIKIGLTCYTYDTREWPGAQKSLNGNVMSDEASDKVNSFCYSDLETFYDSVRDDVAKMKAAGCDATIFFIHWGNEYQDYPSGTQEEIAQTLCDIGVDVIIGGHPHVIQEFDILTNDQGHEMWCLYSMGNTISSQRKEIMVPEEPRGYTEDGLTIEISYMKFNNGKVKIKGIYILPTWVDWRDDGVFAVVPLDWKVDAYDWATAYTGQATDSYNRTLERLGTVYPALRERLGEEKVPDYK